MSFFSGAKAPPPQPVAPAPVAEPVVTQEKEKLKRGVPTKQTILTSVLGIKDKAKVQSKKLLGD